MSITNITRVLDVHWQGLRGATVRLYRKPFITRPMSISGAPAGWNFIYYFKSRPSLQSV